jgi:hypothetical protein
VLNLKVADADGDPVVVTAVASADLRATLTAKPNSPGVYTLQVDATHDANDAAHSIVITLGDGKTSKQVTVAVRMTRAKWATTWNFQADGVAEREHPAVIFDAGHDRILIIGGSGYRPQFVALADTHQVSIKTGKASPLVIEGLTLPAVGSMRVAQVPGTQTAYLFGGYGQDAAGASKSYSDMYLADYSSDAVRFTRLNQTAGPRARSLHGMTYDEATKRIFVFAGIDEKNAPLDDLWVGTASGAEVTWTEKKLTEKPSKRYGFFFGQLDGRSLIYSGAQGTSAVKPARDLWALDTRSAEPSYTKLLEGDDVPVGRRNGCFAVDAKRNKLWIFGGTPDAAKTLPGIWVYDARPSVGKFSEIVRDGAPAMRSSGSAIVDARDGSTYFGFGNDDGIFSDFTRLGF